MKERMAFPGVRSWLWRSEMNSSRAWRTTRRMEELSVMDPPTVQHAAVDSRQPPPPVYPPV